MLKRMRYDPIEGMAQIAVAPNTPPDLHLSAFGDLVTCVVPKCKSVEMDASVQAG